MDDKTCRVFRGSAVDEWAKEQHNLRFVGEQCSREPYMRVTETSDDDDAVPVCKVHGESWLGNEQDARVAEILVATPEEVAAAIASIKEGRPMT